MLIDHQEKVEDIFFVNSKQDNFGFYYHEVKVSGMMSMAQILYVKNILNKKKILSERNVYFKASEFNSGHNFSLFFKKKVDYR